MIRKFKNPLIASLILFFLSACGGIGEKKVAEDKSVNKESEKIETRTALRNSDSSLMEADQNASDVYADGTVRLPINGKPTVVDFTATWCGPCKQMKPIVEKLEKAYGNRVNFVAVDVDDNGALSTEYGIQSIPTFVFLDAKGNEKERIVGAVSRQEIEEEIVDLLD